MGNKFGVGPVPATNGNIATNGARYDPAAANDFTDPAQITIDVKLPWSPCTGKPVDPLPGTPDVRGVFVPHVPELEAGVRRPTDTKWLASGQIVDWEENSNGFPTFVVEWPTEEKLDAAIPEYKATGVMRYPAAYSVSNATLLDARQLLKIEFTADMARGLRVEKEEVPVEGGIHHEKAWGAGASGGPGVIGASDAGGYFDAMDGSNALSSREDFAKLVDDHALFAEGEGYSAVSEAKRVQNARRRLAWACHTPDAVADGGSWPHVCLDENGRKALPAGADEDGWIQVTGGVFIYK